MPPNDSDEARSKAFRDMLRFGMLPQIASRDQERAAYKVGIELRPGRGILRSASIPPGWQVIQTNPTFGKLFDNRGRIRAHISFHKVWHESLPTIMRRAADEVESEALMTLICRFGCRRCSPGGISVQDNTTETTLFFSPDSDDPRPPKRAEAWLNEHYPHWKDPAAYWDGVPPARRWKFWQRP